MNKTENNEMTNDEYVHIAKRIIKFFMVLFVYVIIYFYSIIDLVVNWTDPRGGSSNSKAPILTDTQRWERSTFSIILITITTSFLLYTTYKKIRKMTQNNNHSPLKKNET